jgi:decaprenylphospho-beta-D-erythro-pentofuranosid-2-ulose 2-reductase
VTVVIAGATSAIGREIAAILARRGTTLVLLARRAREAEDIANDLRVRFGAVVSSGELDVRRFDAGSLTSALTAITGLTGFIQCAGYLGDSVQAESDHDEASRILEINFTGTARVLDIAAEELARRKGGFICALSSVAGDRPRRRVRAYGIAKRKLNAHLAALEKQSSQSGVRIITVKLGPVDTRMPYGRRRQPFTVSPENAARGIVAAIDGTSGAVYVPAKWRVIMALIRSIPGPLYDRMDL